MTAFREAHGLSKAHLALLLAVSQFSVGRRKSGKGLPRKAQKAKITELLALLEGQLQQKLSELEVPEAGNVLLKTSKENGDKE